jgi:dephospho-CoA kinase
MRIGIAGYMGAGKSTAAQMLCGASRRLIDADIEAKQLMQLDSSIQQRLADEFGATVIEANTISFSLLGRRAFASSESIERLNRIVHPPLLRRLRELIDAEACTECVLDAALIPLWHIETWFDRLLWITAPQGVRLQRLVQKSILCKEDAQRRMQIQQTMFAEPVLPPWHIINNERSIQELRNNLMAWLPSEAAGA